MKRLWSDADVESEIEARRTRYEQRGEAMPLSVAYSLRQTRSSPVVKEFKIEALLPWNMKSVLHATRYFFNLRGGQTIDPHSMARLRRPDSEPQR